MQVLIGVGVAALVFMGISDSNKRKAAPQVLPDDPWEPPPPPDPNEVAYREGRNIIQKYDQEVRP